MAASEPPEPPPRNPDRINASLHKLSESKIVKSLDSSLIKEKSVSVNNNKPIRPLLSLDNSVTASTSAAAAATAAGAAAAGAGAGTVGGAPVKPSPLVLTSKRDLTPSNDSSSSPASSNGSNQTLTPPMTNDNQQQQQQQQQHRPPSYPGKSEVVGLPQPQLPNGLGGTANANSIPGPAMIHANNSNLIAAGHLAQGVAVSSSSTSTSAANSSSGGSALNAVDKRNANDVCPIVKLMEPESMATARAAPASAPSPAAVSANMNPSLSGFLTLGPPHSPTSAASAALLMLESCDGNRNEETKVRLRESGMKLREENDRLSAELVRLRRLLELSTDGAVGGKEQELRDLYPQLQKRVRESETTNARSRAIEIGERLPAAQAGPG
ncbi:GL16928 [Drosophila persimilis]|uniref:GL16928 n=1 Tax=Drosophila persimilis TaxID=7234 RepID=B4GHJ5_DROPE|nr:GL16928 [Drosophila persimilis]